MLIAGAHADVTSDPFGDNTMLFLTPSEITCRFRFPLPTLWPGANVISGPLTNNIPFVRIRLI